MKGLFGSSLVGDLSNITQKDYDKMEKQKQMISTTLKLLTVQSHNLLHVNH